MHKLKNRPPWASCQIRKIGGCACAGCAGNVLPVSDPDMCHGTCVTHVRDARAVMHLDSFGSNGEDHVPGIHGACTSRNFYISGKRPMAPKTTSRTQSTPTRQQYWWHHDKGTLSASLHFLRESSVNQWVPLTKGQYYDSLMCFDVSADNLLNKHILQVLLMGMVYASTITRWVHLPDVWGLALLETLWLQPWMQWTTRRTTAYTSRTVKSSSRACAMEKDGRHR